MKENKQQNGQKVKTKGGTGKAILAFFLGILFGIILLLGAVAGTVFYVIKTDLDKVLGWFNVDNSADENGDNKYINTNKDNDGVENILELVKRVVSMTGNVQSLTLGEIDDLVPAARGLVDQIIEAVGDYITIDYDELSKVRFSEFEAYFSDLVLDIRPAVIVEKSGGEINKLMDLVLYGVEADCVTVNGIIYPLYQDTVTEKYIYEVGNSWYIAEESDGVFTSTGAQYQSYNKDNTEATGNYYTVNGVRQIIDPITIRSFMGTDGLGALGKVTVAELVGDMSQGDSDLLNQVLGDVILNDLLNGEVNLDETINSIEIGLLLDVDPFNDEMLLYFAYGLSDLSETANADGLYTAVYKLEETDIPVLVSIEDNKIKKIIDAATGEELSGTTVGNIDKVIDNIEVTVLVKVAPTNKILTYIAYGLTGVEQTEEGWRGYYNGQMCAISVDEDGNITSVKNVETGEVLSAAGIDELNDRLNTITDDLTIGDIIEVKDGDKLMAKLAGYKINEVGDAIHTFELGDVMDIDANSTLMAYLGYGITDVDVENGTATYHYETEDGEKAEKAVLITVNDGMIAEVYFMQDGEKVLVEGTKINGVSKRIDGLMGDLTIGELIDIDDGNTVLRAIRNSTINSLSSDIDKLTVNELYAEAIYGNSVLKKVVKSGAGEGEIDFKPEYLFYEKVNGEYKLVNGTGKVAEFSDGLYTYGATTGFWKLLIAESGDNGAKTERAYTLNSITEMADNATENLQKCTLFELEEAGILDFSSSANDPLNVQISAEAKLGDLTITEAVVFIADILSQLH